MKHQDQMVHPQYLGSILGSSAVKLINNVLEEMKLDIVGSGVKVNYVPDKDGLNACRELGKKIAEKLPK